MDITIVELINGEKQEIEIKENKYIEYLEKVIDFMGFNQKVNIEQCRKIGKILFIGGILICIFSMFFLRKGLEGAWLYTPVGGFLLLLGFSYMNKKHNYKKRIILNIVATGVLIISILMCDLLNVVAFNKQPKFSYCGYVNSSLYCETLFFDAYRCYDQDDRYHIIYKGYIDTYEETVGPFDFCD